MTNNPGRDTITELVDKLTLTETDKTLKKSLEICKQFDKESTGKLNIANFINILKYNMEIRNVWTQEQVDSLMLKLENEHIKKMGLTTIDYSEIFDRIKINATR